MRERWKSNFVFVLAAIGSAVGLGNVWRFPYLAFKYGGGAFLIPYLLALFVVGIPLLILEFFLGQKFQAGAINAFKKIDSRLQGIGFAAIFAGFMVVIYYAVVMAWSLAYLFFSFNPNLPWKENAKNFFFNEVLKISPNINVLGEINYLLLAALLVVWLLIFFSVRKGTKSVGKVVLLTVPLPVILLVALFLRGITLPGSLEGIIVYLSPNFLALLDLEVWLAAVSQIFFTLSLGFGIMIAYASYNKEDSDINKNAFVTSLSNSAISLFAGFVVFSVIGYMAFQSNLPIEKVVSSGPGLAFVVFPEALSLMPFSWIFAVLFFLMLLTLGIDSAFSLVEALNTVLHEKLKHLTKQKISFVVCSTAFVLGIIYTTSAGLYFLDVVDHFVTNFALVLVGLAQSIAVAWVYGAENARKQINKVSNIKIGKWWVYTTKYVIPLALLILLAFQFLKELNGNYGSYPDWAILFGWTTVFIPIIIFAYYFLIGKKSAK